jgi:hypothetical protein
MNRLNIEERTAIIRCLIEGNSIRSTASRPLRLTKRLPLF